jgi:uncharacterized protein (DUF433 family)
MAIELEYPHIEAASAHGTPARLRRVPRVRVAQVVMDYLVHGWSPEEMSRQHPYLTPAEAHAAMAYYYDHAEQVDAEIREELEQLKRDRAAAPTRALRSRLTAGKQG